jgi:hypothetical protein
VSFVDGHLADAGVAVATDRGCGDQRARLAAETAQGHDKLAERAYSRAALRLDVLPAVPAPVEQRAAGQVNDGIGPLEVAAALLRQAHRVPGHVAGRARHDVLRADRVAAEDGHQVPGP